MVREIRLELTCPFGRQHLKLVRLPISPLALTWYQARDYRGFWLGLSTLSFKKICSETSGNSPGTPFWLTGFGNARVLRSEGHQIRRKDAAERKWLEKEGHMRRLLRSSMELEGLLKLLRTETDRRSRQVIWTEAVMKLAQLEEELRRSL